MARKTIKCRGCGRIINLEKDEYVYFDTGRNGRKCNTRFHNQTCIDEFIERRAENDSKNEHKQKYERKMSDEDIKLFDEIYEILRTDIMGYPPHIPLSTNMVHKIKALRKGKNFNDRTEESDNNCIGYESILIALKFYKSSIRGAIHNKSFNGGDMGKFSYAMAILKKHVHEVEARRLKIKQGEKRVEGHKVSATTMQSQSDAFMRKKAQQKQEKSELLDGLI